MTVVQIQALLIQRGKAAYAFTRSSNVWELAFINDQIVIQTWDESLLGPRPLDAELPIEEDANSTILTWKLANPTVEQAFAALAAEISTMFGITLTSESQLAGMVDALTAASDARVEAAMLQGWEAAVREIQAQKRVLFRFAVLMFRENKKS